MPLKTTQERASELRMQFPVSSGQQHRRTEKEWVPVSPKKKEPSPQPVAPKVIEPPVPIPMTTVAAIMPPSITTTTTVAVPGPQVFPPSKPDVCSTCVMLN